MRKLLSADFSRLWRSKIFWVMEGISAILGAFFYILAIVNTRNIGNNWYLGNGNYYFFIVLVCVGVEMAVFSGFFTGTEYSEGTIRNKLTVGHSRADIYMANLVIAVVAGILFTITHITVSLLVGLPFLGGLIWEALATVGWRIFTGIILILCYGAIFTFFSMQDGNKSRNLIITFALSLVIILGGLLTYSRLQEPEFTSRMVMQEDGSYQRQEGIPNSKYLSGTIRTVYTFLDACIPASQAYNIARYEGECNTLAIVCMLGEMLVFTAVGVVNFRKKDIK